MYIICVYSGVRPHEDGAHPRVGLHLLQGILYYYYGIVILLLLLLKCVCIYLYPS